MFLETMVLICILPASVVVIDMFYSIRDNWKGSHTGPYRLIGEK
jgi:hypothetical protein